MHPQTPNHIAPVLNSAAHHYRQLIASRVEARRLNERTDDLIAVLRKHGLADVPREEITSFLVANT